MIEAFFDTVFEILFPLVILGVPLMGLGALSGYLFGKQETVRTLKHCSQVVAAAIGVVAVYAWRSLQSLNARIHRAVLAFVSDDAIPAVGYIRRRPLPVQASEFWAEIERLDDRIERLQELVDDAHDHLPTVEDRVL